MILSRRQRESLLDEMNRMIANKQSVAFANHSKISERVSNSDLSFYINSPDKEFIIKYSNNEMKLNAKEKTFSELTALIFSNKNKITGISDSGRNDSTIALSSKWAYNKDLETLKRMKKYNPEGISGSGIVEIIGITDEGKYTEQHLLTYEYWKDHQEEQHEEDEKNYDERYAFKDHIHQEYATKEELAFKSDITHDHADKYLTKSEIIDLIDDETSTPWYERLFKGLEILQDAAQDGYLFWLQEQINAIYGILYAQGIVVTTGELSGVGAAVTGVGDKLRTAANVFDKIGDRFQSVKKFTDTCSKYLNKGADALTRFDKIRVEFTRDIGANIEGLSNKFVEFFNGHSVTPVTDTWEMVTIGGGRNPIPNLVEVASGGGEIMDLIEFRTLVNV